MGHAGESGRPGMEVLAHELAGERPKKSQTLDMRPKTRRGCQSEAWASLIQSRQAPRPSQVFSYLEEACPPTPAMPIQSAFPSLWVHI